MSKRRNFTPEQKIAIVREHLLEGVPVSELIDKYQIHAVQYYQWQKRLFEEGGSVFERKSNGANERRQQTAQERKIEQLEFLPMSTTGGFLATTGLQPPRSRRSWTTTLRTPAKAIAA
jgi:transposase